MPPQAHSAFGPSQIKNKATCPKYTNDETSDTTAADEGTMMHGSAETGNFDGLDEEQEAAVRAALAYVKMYEAGAKEIHKEIRLEIPICGFGTSDRIVIQRDGTADVFDFKFGRRSVDAPETNLQAWAYTLGVFKRWPELKAVRAHIVQPRRDEMMMHEFKPVDVPVLLAQIQAIANRANNPDAEPRPTWLCSYCGSRATCSALTTMGMEVWENYADDKVERVGLPDEYHPSKITDPAQMARAYEAAKVLEQWARSVKQHAVMMRRDGVEIPGYELKFRQGNRSVKDVRTAWKALDDIMDLDEFLSCCSVGLPALEAIAKEKAQPGQKARAAHYIHDVLSDADCVVRGRETEYLKKIS